MLESGYLACAVCAAWFIALLFIKEKLPTSLILSASAGVICGAAAYALDRFGLSVWAVPAAALVFVIPALMALLREKEYKGNAAIALFIA